MLANLAIGDSFMGVYLVTMASVDVHYRGDYARHDVTWKESKLCTFAGFLATLSAELSMLTLTLITVDRFIVIAINSPTVRLGKHHVKMLLFSIWLFVLLLCLVPCFDNPYFENFYGQSEMCLPIPISSERHTKVNYLVREIYPSDEMMPVTNLTAQPITTDRPNGWEYSLFVFVGLNGTAFVAIFIMYVWMFFSVKRTRAAARSSQMKSDLALARKMIVIVSTNAFCWFPVIGLAIYCLMGNILELRVSCFLCYRLPFCCDHEHGVSLFSSSSP